jgi:hypothetical protein
MKRMLLLLLVGCAGWHMQAMAEEVCKSKQLKNPAPTLADMYAMALADAKAWKADALPASITNTSLGPLQPEGSSAAWNLIFFSDGAKANVAISTFRGTYRCWADAGPAGRMPDLKPDFMRDGAKLYAIAKERGGALLGQGYTIMLGTAAAPSNRHATWNINYMKDNRSGNILVLVDANTGVVEKVIKD